MSSQRSYGIVLTIAVAAGIFWISFDAGTFSLQSRTVLAITAWWAILVVLIFRIGRTLPIPATAFIAGGSLSALAAWTLASLAWTASAEDTFVEFNRISLYAGVFWLVVILGRREIAERLSDGMATGLTAIGLLALAGRLFPTALPESDVAELLPSAATRLSWPVEYWNGLAVLIALAVPLLLRAAMMGERLFFRALAIAPLPALAAAVYLTSSRGGIVTAAVGALVFIGLSRRRWAACGAVVVAAAGAAVAIGVLLTREQLVNGPLGSDAAISEGRSAAGLIVLACAATALAYVIGVRLLGTREIPSIAGRAAALLALLGVVVLALAADPDRRFEDFKAPPPATLPSDPDFVRVHLGSGSGSGRWQYWTAAIEQWKTAPFFGAAAGSYEAWWTEHGRLAQPVRDAHSLYLEALAELGVVGFVLIVGAFSTGLISGVHRALRPTLEASPAAAFTACFSAYVFAAGVDWMWELTAATFVGVVCLGLVTGPATAEAQGSVPGARRTPRQAWRRLVLPLGLIAVWALLCAQVISLLSHMKLEDSRAAVRRGNAEQALSDAAAARALQPWAASPYLQLALVEEQSEDIASARRWISEALERDATDWRLWLVAARIQTKQGQLAEARASLRRAADLNPRSSLFTDLRE